MSKFLYHEACPNCGSKDNLGVWDDGHKWCFGCKYYEHGKIDVRKIHTDVPNIAANPRTFPEDAEHYIPKEPMEWLLSCGITHTEQRQYNIQWSEKHKLLCWKLDGKCWQGRCFDKNAKTKYISAGPIHEEAFILNATGNQLVLVEDYMSALRVSPYSACMPLFGCTIKPELLNGLLKQFKVILVWLDADKLDNGRKIASDASLLGFEAGVIYTEKDPKAYTNDEIKEIVNANYIK